MAQDKKKNFLQNLIDSIFGGSDADAEKKRQLKAISKKLSKSKYNKFYKYQGNEALPFLARNFFEIYKYIYPAQTMFQNIQNPNILKQLAIDFSTPQEIKQLEESLDEANLQKISKDISAAKLQEQAMKRLSDYSDYYTLEKITAIDGLYKQLIALKDFCTFDYFFLLKKFNKSLRESDFTTTPNFEKINAEYVLDELKDFVAIAWALPLDADWQNCIKLLRSYKGVEPITIQNLKKVLMRLSSLKQSGIFEMMIKLISGNPGHTVTTNDYSSNIIEPHIDSIKASTEKIINKLIEEERNSKTNEITDQLFPNSELVPLKNYADSWNTTFVRKRLNTFENISALNYLKTFLIEIFKKDIRSYYDLVLVRGHWDATTLSAPFSDAYNNLLSTCDKITEFDSLLAEDAPIGMKIKTLLPKTDRDSSAKNIINRLINDANESAYGFVIESTRHLITMGKIIKSLIEDYQKQKPVLVTNWKELEHYADTPIKDFSVDLYKKIALFANLIKTVIVNPEED